MGENRNHPKTPTKASRDFIYRSHQLLLVLSESTHPKPQTLTPKPQTPNPKETRGSALSAGEPGAEVQGPKDPRSGVGGLGLRV